MIILKKHKKTGAKGEDFNMAVVTKPKNNAFVVAEDKFEEFSKRRKNDDKLKLILAKAEKMKKRIVKR